MIKICMKVVFHFWCRLPAFAFQFSQGTVTISTMVSWVCLLSGVFPEVGDKLRAEIDSCVEDAPNATIEDCAKLEYLDLVVKEALRHFTVPFIARKAKKDIQVPG